MKRALLILFVLGCEVAATNPFDPETPAAQQAVSRVTGQLVLPADFEDFGEAQVDLYAATAPGEVAYSAEVDGDGAFAVDAVLPGGYVARTAAPGFRAGDVVFEAPIGEPVDLGEIRLVALAAGGASIRGTARRAHADATHEGIVVAARGTPFTTVTGADGEFALPLNAGEFTLQFSAPGYVSADAPPIRVAAGEVAVAETIELLPAPGAISGRVVLGSGVGAVQDVDLSLLVDPDGEPLQVASPTATGAFAFVDVPAGDYLIDVRRDGFTPRQLAITVEAGARVALGDVFLAGADFSVAIEGVATTSGADHAGTRVRLDGSDLSTETDGEGAFQLVAPLREEPYLLRFERAGYNAETATAEPPDAEAVAAARAAGERSLTVTTTPARIELTGRPGTLRGRVSLAAGFDDPDTLAQVSIRLLAFAEPGEPIETRVPDPEGFYVFGQVPAGEYLIEYTLAGFRPQSNEASVAPGEAVLLPEIRLSPALEAERSFIEGEVTRDCVGCEQGGVRIEALNTPFVAVSGATGQFRLEVVGGRRYTLRFFAPGYTPVEVADVQARSNEATAVDPVQLEPLAGVVRATVVLPRFGTPARVQGADVSLWTDPPGEDAVAQDQPAADGAVLLVDVAPGAYLARVTAAGYMDAERPLFVEPGGTVFAGVFELRHQSESGDAVPLAGRALRADAETHDGSEVRVRLVQPDLAFASTTTDAGGGFEVRASPEERYTVRILRPDYGAVDVGPLAWDAADARFEDEAGAPVDALLARAPVAGEVSAQVRMAPAWLPVAERYVQARLTGLDVDHAQLAPRVEPGPDGVTFDNVPSGRYQLRLERPGFTVAERVVVVTPAAPIRDVGPLDVALVSLAQAGLDLRGVQLDACDLSGLNVRAASLAGAVLTGDFGGACGPFDFTGADLSGADLTGATLSGGRPPVLTAATFIGADLTGVSLAGVVARGADFFAARLAQTDWQGADLRQVNFTGADLSGARFGPYQSGDDGQPLVGGPPWAGLLVPDFDTRRPAFCGDRPATVDLDGASFARANLSDAFLAGVDLAEVDFAGARLAGTDLRFACLQAAELSLLDLEGAVLDGSDAFQAQLTSSLLSGTSLRGVRLTASSLINTVVDGANLSPFPDCPLPEWEVYTDRNGCDGRPNEDPECRCRTRLDRASLDGANLVGVYFESTDLAGASVLGVTFGAANRLARSQPPSCEPQAYATCEAVRQIEQECRLGRVPLDSCADRPGLALEGIGPELLACIIERHRQGGCEADFDQCDEGEPFPVDPPECTWQMLVDSVERGDDAVDACTYTHPACTVEPTQFIDARLHDARMDGVVLSQVEMRETLLDGTSMENATLRAVRFEDMSFTGANLSSATLIDAVLAGQNLTGADFTWAQLAGADLTEARINQTDFTDADLRRVQIAGEVPGERPPIFVRADLSGATLTERQWIAVDFTDADLSRTEFVAIGLSRSLFRGADLDGTLFHHALLERADFQGTRIRGVDFRSSPARGANMAFTVLNDVRINPQGSPLDWRQLNLANAQLDGVDLNQNSGPGGSLDLSEVRLQGSRLSDVDLATADMTGAGLAGATVLRSDLSDTDLSQSCTSNSTALEDTNLFGASVVGVQFSGVSLRGSNLENVDLTRSCNVRHADLNGTNLNGAQICTTEQAAITSANRHVGTPRFVNCRVPAACNQVCP